MTDVKFTMEDQLGSSFLFGGSAAYLEEQYEAYLQNPQAVSAPWKAYFDALPKVKGNTSQDVSHAAIREKFLAITAKPTTVMATGSEDQERKQASVSQLITAYRSQGHRLANLDPLGFRTFPLLPSLQLSHHHLSDRDLNTEFNTNSFATIGKKTATLDTIWNDLKKIYCANLGFEYMYINDTNEVEWIQRYIEPFCGNPQLNKEEKCRILKMLAAAEGLERYLGTRFVGQKRFSLEGGDSFLPMMDELVRRSAMQGVQEVVIGMAHRGRLNVLVNILGKAPAKLFDEFEGKYDHTDLSGDVKYHKGYSSNVSTPGGIVHLVLGFNPSHLEIIAPVVEGAVRARQDRREDSAGRQVLPIIVHGDAAFAAQGVVMETFALSQAVGYKTGGTVHIVINNQIGFTTNNPLDSGRNSYSTDIAKMVQAPIIHVNGDDPESVIFATRLALDYRMNFQRDVVIDLVCYRRYGHNESDEPSMTQPVLYQAIKEHPTTLTLYGQQLVAEGVLSAEAVTAMSENYRKALEAGQPVVDLSSDHMHAFKTDWKPYWGTHWQAPADTKVAKDDLTVLGELVTAVPPDFVLQPQVAKEYEARRAMVAGQQPLHWGMGETLAYATLLNQGFAVRLAGQDSERGTFSHRHAVLHDIHNDMCYTPLEHISPDQGRFTILDTILSEEAVLGFECGYASAEPETLVIWEAQFGDFFNGAQVLIDQFISSSEQKWGRLCGVVMFLPHGLEGMGPEHSSARIERFLQLCAQENIQVVVPTTPAQHYHLLRRQMIRNYRKPLVVMTPKSLLRNRQAVSTLDELSEGEFHPVLGETEKLQPTEVKRLIMCSGKVYYDLVQQRTKLARTDVAILRLEQLYPFPQAAVEAELKRYTQADTLVWCQDEAQNQGTWLFAKELLQPLLTQGQRLCYAGRAAAAAPAVGSAGLHAKQQQALVEAAFTV